VSFGKQLSEVSQAFIFRLRHFFLACSTPEEESTVILPNAGNYSPTDSLKSQKT
jgi:hypothetical protein